MALYHAYSQTVGDGTATSVVRPSDWNSGHVFQHTLSGNTAGTSAFTASNVVYQGGNNVTLSASTVANAATVVFSAANQTNQTAMPVNLYAVSNTTQSSQGTGNASALSFAGAGHASVGVTNNSVVVSVPAFNVSLLGNIAPGASSTVPDGADGTMYISGGNNVTLSGNGSTLVISAAAGGGAPLRYYAPQDIVVNSSTLAHPKQSTFHVQPFFVPENVSCDFIRLFMLGATQAASTTAATTGNTQFSAGYSASHRFIIYTRGSGASSLSLQSYFSTQITEQYSHNLSCAANSTQFSYSYRYTLPFSTGTIGITADYSSSAASLNFHSTGAVTQVTGTKQVDFPLATTFAPGMYWLAYNISSATATQAAGTTIGLRNIVTFNPVYITQAALSAGQFGAATTNTVMWQRGIGSFTTVGGASTASMGLTNITASAGHPTLYFQLMQTD